MIDPARVGYSGAAVAWANDAILAYGPLARHLLDRCPVPLDGTTVLDAGAGTGAAGILLRERGAFVVAVDLQAEMLRFAAPTTVGAVADVTALPFRGNAFDVVVAAFVINHLSVPADGLRAMRNVCRRDGVVLASSFSAERAVAKGSVDEVAKQHGWRPPAWYSEIRDRGASVSTRAQMSAAAASAGLVDVAVTDTEVDVGLDDPALVARYRLGMPQLTDFLAGLSAARRHDFERDAIAAIAATGEVFRPRVVELVGRVT